ITEVTQEQGQMKIIIFGATGTGKTTLGKSISEKLNWTFLDSDDYYWEKTNPPFQTKIPLQKRNENLKTDFENNENVIISGSLCTWSKFWDSAFDLGIFLRISKKVRMKRLLNREIERYGAELYTNEKIKEKSKIFLNWAEKYDDETNDGHSIRQHKNWIELLNCAVIEVIGDLTNDERLIIILKKIENHQQKGDCQMP
ncbi:MAG: AAA family ATPase, partial [Saprospiraceae bacterium]